MLYYPGGQRPLLREPLKGAFRFSLYAVANQQKGATMNELNLTRRGFLTAAGAIGAMGAAAGLFGCSKSGSQESASASTVDSASATAASAIGSVELDSAAWGYDSDNDVYYQVGVQYCASPQAPTYESMGIYVPGAYFDATDNGDGTFTCTPSATGEVDGYTAATAPIVMPINTAGYSAQAAPVEYSSKGVTDYLEAGFVYVYAGCRGRKLEDDACGAAPWGVTDLKAAVRTLRYNDELIPGDKGRIFSFGHSGGGAQSAVLGASGDVEGYSDYLAAIGAPTADPHGNELSDTIYGAMCWCPITCLMGADAAYEWNMGQFATSGTRAEGTFTRQLSQDLAAEYRDYVNALGLVDANGATLALEDGGEGVACAGTYYDYVKSQVELSLNNFLADTEFPYTPSGSFNADMGAGGGRGGSHSGGAPSGEKPSGEPPSRSHGSAGGGTSESSGQSGSSDSATYETAADYIAALNGDDAWVAYDESTNTATITGLAGFVNACKSPSKDVGAFDAFDRSKAENEVFGSDSNEGLHFDSIMAVLLADNAEVYAALTGWDEAYPSDYANDMEYADAQEKSSGFRQELYDPLYYLSAAYEGEGTSRPAAHWRIRSGIEQGDTASTTEINLALALGMSEQVDDVDFATVWGQGHTMAERTGSSTENFISWVKECCG